ncbi:MAG: esterase-like activity of phytase family protein [Nostocaceae cyanobacterium]|nr:esterase-like activity of phytase family protein [Nostocaceae cyanobacterium]
MKRKSSRKSQNSRKFVFLYITILFISFFFLNLAAPAISITKVDFLGEANLLTGLQFKNTALGGLSGITYDAKKDIYYAVSDDRSLNNPARLYHLKINLAQDRLRKNGVTPIAVTTLLDSRGKPFPEGSIDPEGIAFTENGTVFVSSEGDVLTSIEPAIKEFSLSSGRELRTLPIPDKLLLDSSGKRGIHNNLALESLTITPNQKYLYTAVENALVQDGQVATPNTKNPCRIIQYNLLTNQPEKEFLYFTEPVGKFFSLINKFYSGIADLVALDNQGHFLSLERSFTGWGFSIAVFEVSLEGADNIQNIDSLLAVDINKIKPVKKKLLLDLNSLNVGLDNIEGLTLGSPLDDGRRSLILVSDNNFIFPQRTQVIALRLKTERPLLSRLRRLVGILKLSLGVG